MTIRHFIHLLFKFLRLHRIKIINFCKSYKPIRNIMHVSLWITMCNCSAICRRLMHRGKYVSRMLYWIIRSLGITSCSVMLGSFIYTKRCHFTFTTVIWTRIQCLVRDCDACQRYKLPGKGYGELPPREAQLAPWQEIAVNLIGPWKICVNDHQVSFCALSIIDTVTNLPELVRINSKSAAHVGLQLENAWLSRYPRPQDIIFDQGSEFLGLGFQRVLELSLIHI